MNVASVSSEAGRVREAADFIHRRSNDEIRASRSHGCRLPRDSSIVAQAQPRTELGASVISSIFALEDESLSSVGVPSAGLGLFNQGAYLSVFLADRFAIEPQLGFMWASFDGESQHILNLSGQFTYFASGIDSSSPYIFGTAGFLDVSDEDHTPQSYGVGAGYRLPAGDRLVFRIDGRYTRYAGEFDAQDLDTVAVGLSIGGLFGQP